LRETHLHCVTFNTTMNNDNTIYVVDEIEAKEDAYHMGYNRFKGMDTLKEDELLEFHLFTESAQWANNIAPQLRAMAGAKDSGHGTYQQHSEIVTVTEPRDSPMEGQQCDSFELYSELIDMYRQGAEHAARGRDKQVWD